MRRLTHSFGILVAAALTLAACIAGPTGNPRPPQPAKPVALDRYLGRWYEAARYDMRFEKGCEGVTADYALRPDGLVSVTNTCRQGAVDGPVKVAVGKAKVVDPATGAKLKVSFFGPFYGDYWVLDHADDYSWSIVGEGSGRYLWLLTRTPATPERLRDLTARAQAMGYDIGRLRITRQPPPPGS